jgi:hypothetical protein
MSEETDEKLVHGLFGSVASCLDERVSKARRIELYGLLMLYLFKGTDQHRIRNWLSATGVNFEFLRWRRLLHRNGMLLLNCKVYTFAYFVGDRSVTPASCNLSQEEALACRQACKHPELAAKLQEFIDEDRALFSMSGLSDMIGKALTCRDIRGYLGHYVGTRLAFLHGYGYDSDTLKSDMKSWALYALLRAYPRYDDKGHILSIVKTAMHNHAQNIVKHATSQKNQHLTTDSDGTCHARVLSLDFGETSDVTSLIEEPGSSTVTSSYLVTNIEGTTQGNWEQLFALRELMNNDRLKPVQRQFLLLLTGAHDADFSAWLGQSNSAAYESMSFEKYMDRATAFIGADSRKVQQLFAGLRNLV